MGETDISRRLAIVWHSRTGASKALASAAASGARGEGAEVHLTPASEAEPELLLSCGGYLFVAPENLGSLSGMMKEMLDRCYYPLLGRIEGRPYASIIAAGSDGDGAQRQLDQIVTGWRLRRMADPIIAHMDAQTSEDILAAKVISPAQALQASELGSAMGAGLLMGVI